MRGCVDGALAWTATCPRMDAFDIFDVGDEPSSSTPPTAPTLLPRASAHPHFSVCNSLWPPPLKSSPAPDAINPVHEYASQHAEQCARHLRKSRSEYGRTCAKSLVAACEAFERDDTAYREHARACRDLCATAIEESNWDVAAWHEANLLSLALLLVESEARDGDSNNLSAAAVGQTAIALFNLCVAAAAPLPAGSAPAWMPMVSALLQRAERTVSSAYDLAPPDKALWTIPTAPPGHGRTPTLNPSRAVKTIEASAMPCATFLLEHLQPGVPLLLKGHLHAEKWAALEYFKDLRQLYDDCGERLVPVNLGSPLVDYAGVAHWPMRKLVEEHLLPSNATHDQPPPSTAKPDEETYVKVAYMSQHHLLHQHAPLCELLAIPPYTLGRELSPANVWIGTRGTVTSLHSDPSDNLLCQVAGYKYFRLYALDQTPKLYATTQRANNTNSFGTSPIRCELPLPPEHSLAEDAEYVEGILAPGDMLFLPKSMWHYVRSLTTSVSVNFWF